MDHYSYSKLDTYKGCPLRFKLKYIEKRPEPKSQALLNGSAVHEAIKEYTQYCLSNGLQTDLQFLREFPGNEEVRGILETYADTHMIEPGEYVYEDMWKLSMDPHPWTWWGVIDLLKIEGERLIITDYKSDHAIRSQTDIDRDEQLRAYAWMASKKYPTAQEFICGIDFVRHGVLRQTTYTIDDIPGIEKRIVDQIMAVEADKKYRATPGAHCGYCTWTDECNAVKAANIPVVSSEDEAGQAAAQLIALKARIKALEDLLKPWASANGSIEVNGMEVGYVKSESYGYQIDDIVAFAMGNRLDQYSLLQPSTTALKKLAKNPDFADDLAAIAIDKSKTNFTIRKAVAA